MKLVEPRTPRVTRDADDVEHPEIPFTAEWGRMVRNARKQKGMSQEQLAKDARVKQSLISQIEKHIVKSSRAVVPISRVLGIPLPLPRAGDELEERWVNAGRALRWSNESGFKGLLAAAESLISKKKPSEH